MMKKTPAWLFLLPVLLLPACNQNGGGGTDPDENALLHIQMSMDCAGKTGCTRILVDGLQAADEVAAGGEITVQVEVGNHTIYASGGCQETRIWGPFTVNVPAAGRTQVLSCAPEASVMLTAEADGNCGGIERDIDVTLDDAGIGTLQPGGSFSLYISPGLHTLAAHSAGGFRWGPQVRSISPPKAMEKFSCDPLAKAPLMVSVSADCPGLDYVQIWVDADYLGQVLCGAESHTKDYSMGYRMITAKGYKITQLEPYSAGPYEVYLAKEGTQFIIPGGDFHMSAANSWTRRP